MQIYLNGIYGMDDAFQALLMSKRSWTPEKRDHIIENCEEVLTRYGHIRSHVPDDKLDEYRKRLAATLKYGVKHITLLKFIDLSFTVEGLHRAGQDDWDSHAERFHNRIVRSSTRLADFGTGEMSDWYQGKILPLEDALQLLDNDLPEEIVKDGVTYVRAVNGYIRKGMENDKDVKRGLYMLSIPSNFIFKCDLANFAHVYKQRGAHGTANPEVKQAAEMMVDAIQAYQPDITREVLMRVEN